MALLSRARATPGLRAVTIAVALTLAGPASGAGVKLPPAVAEAIADAKPFEKYTVEEASTAFGGVALVTDELVFEPGGDLVLDPGGADFVVIQAKRMRFVDGSRPSYIRHQPTPLMPGLDGKPGSPGWSGGAPWGRDGGAGGEGGDGTPGQSFGPPPLYLIVDAVVDASGLAAPALTIDLRGQDGMDGGDGGPGGIGGAGERGMPGYSNAQYCERPPGDGGDGGPGGAGGHGGAGGAGGDGGDVILGGQAAFLTIAEAFVYELGPGSPGAGGAPGPGPPRSPGGYAGKDAPFCAPAREGEPGAEGEEGRPGSPGAAGRAGSILKLEP